MSETLPTEPTYSDFEEFTANTRVVAQQTMDENDWKPAALEAEYILDSYVNVVQKYDVEQFRKFPTFDRITGGSVIPGNVKMAHILITSQLLLKGAPTEADEEITGKEVLSESWQSTGYSRNFGAKGNGAGQLSDKENMNIPPLALRLLAQWYVHSAGLTY